LLALAAVWLACPVQAQWGVAETRDVVYTQGGGAPQKLDLFVPVPMTVAKRPAIVFVHGGGWSGGSKADFTDWARYYARKGYVCTSIDYRLAPRHVWPAQIDDAHASVRWLRKNAAVLGVDARRIAALGASAGGHLVLLLGTTETLNDVDPDLHGYSSKVQAVVDYYGPTDFRYPKEWDPLVWGLIESMVGKPVTESPWLYRQAAPLSHVSADDAPMLVFQGTVDPIVPPVQSRRLDALLTSLEMSHQYHEFPYEGHGFSTLEVFFFCFWQTDLWLSKNLR